MARRLKQAESSDLTRRKILEAAERLFARGGYHATSVDDVAEAAGFSKGAFYYHFASKDELFEALVVANVEGLVTTLEEALAGAETIEAKLSAAQHVLTERERTKGGHLELEVLVQALRDPKLRRKVVAAYQRMRDAISSLIGDQFAAAGARPPMDPSDLATAIMAGALGHGLMHAMDPDAVPPGLLPSVVALLLRP